MQISCKLTELFDICFFIVQLRYLPRLPATIKNQNMASTDDEDPAWKRARVTRNIDQSIDRAWGLYRYYRWKQDGKIDFLLEMFDVIDKLNVAPAVADQKFTSREQLLPVLVSVASNAIANYQILEFLALSEDDGEADALADRIQQNLLRSLTYYPQNAAAWSMAASFTRIRSNDLLLAGILYSHSAKCAKSERTKALDYLSGESVWDNSEKWIEFKLWIELLLVDEVTCVERLEGDKERLEGDKDNELWSSSAMEGTARFLAAMIFSTIQEHAKAAEQLSHFQSLTHRLHPNVWKMPRTLCSTTSSQLSQQVPIAFVRPTGVLHPVVYQRLCEVFHPDATYWKESDYYDRSYYSFFLDLPNEAKTHTNRPIAATNLIEDVVCNHLLPLVRQQLGNEAEKIVGYEWWVHTRPVTANLGHQLHFDTDETLLAQDRHVTHPIISSVLYLTAPPGTGATIILDQTPESRVNAGKAWYCEPVDNSFILFPGNLLHGALPCLGVLLPTKESHSGASDPSDLLSNLTSALKSKKQRQSAGNRLTLMVGFWTRRVPDSMKDRKLYGPCGALPPKEETAWVETIFKGYPMEPAHQTMSKEFSGTALHSVAPAWEEISVAKEPKEIPIEIPKEYDHRFFIANAPYCFRDSLFERNLKDL